MADGRARAVRLDLAVAVSAASPAPTAARPTSRSARCGSRSRARQAIDDEEARRGRARAIRCALLAAWWALRMIDEATVAVEPQRRGKRLFVGVRVSVQTANALAQARRDAAAARARRRARRQVGRADELPRDAEVPRLDARRRDRRGRATRSSAAVAGAPRFRFGPRGSARFRRSTRRACCGRHRGWRRRSTELAGRVEAALAGGRLRAPRRGLSSARDARAAPRNSTL